MLQAVYQHFAGSCMMLMRPGEEDEAHYCGTAFVVHGDGYLLTSSACTDEEQELVAVPTQVDTGFHPATREEVSPIPVRVVRTDPEQGIALLKIVPDLKVTVPAHIVGNAETVGPGSTLIALGFSFGHHRLHSLVSRLATLSAKIEAPDGSRLLLFDAFARDGDIGGPLVSPQDGRAVGIIRGRFDPVEFWREEHHRGAEADATLSYATSIEYGAALLEAEGVTVL